MINTVIFDLDDTLYDEIDYCKSGFAAVADFLHNANPFVSKQSFFDEIWSQKMYRTPLIDPELTPKQR